MRRPTLLSIRARSFLSGQPTVEQVIARASRTLGRPWRWLRPLARRYAEAIAGRTRPRRRDVIQFLHEDSGFEIAQSRYARELRVAEWLAKPQQMQPVAAAESWDVPAIESVGALADWFWLDPAELEWFADLRGLGYKKTSARLRHYHYRMIAKRSGSIRLIEAPKPRLKKLQRQILDWILEKVPPHPAVHGFQKGRSIRTFVAPHVGQRVVLRMDLQDFFPTFAPPEFRPSFAHSAIPNQLPICSTESARTLFPAMYGTIQRSIPPNCGKRGHCTVDRIYPKARPPRRRSPTFVHTAWIAA